MTFNTLIEMRRLFRLRSRVIEGIKQDVKQQYTGSVMGLFWVILFPMLQLGIYAALYTVIFKVRPSGLTEYSYTLLVFSGLVPLLAFSQALGAAAGALNSNKQLLLNTVFPADLIPVRAALAAQVPSLFALVITLVLGYALGRSGWQAIILVPFFWILLMMFTIGLGWMLSLLSLLVHDIQHGLGLILMLVIVLSPFAYTPEMVPASLKFIVYLNPLSYFVLSFQQLIVYGTWPDLVPALGSLALALSFFYFGFVLFRRAKAVFFDYA